MDKKDRKFAIPYNGSNVDDYLNKLKPYLNNIEQVYLGIPTLAENHQNIRYGEDNSWYDVLEYENNCYEFLEKTKGSSFKRFIVLNSPCYSLSTKEYLIFVHQKFSDIIRTLSADGVIISDFELGLAIKYAFPDLEIQTSCNAYIWNISEMYRWKNELGVKVFNPPREILRTPDKLKEMKDEGFSLKCIVNEGCVYGCPMNLSHCIKLRDGINCYALYCDRCSLDNIFKCDWILPRHLKLYDEYVDIYKIVGRIIKDSSILFKSIDFYVNERNDGNLSDIVGGNMIFNKMKNTIPMKIIPDKILTCECKECMGNNKTCDICEKILEKVTKNV